jgi:hypothetical protein
LAGEGKIMPVIKVNMALPGPTVGVRILPNHTNEGLIAMRIQYFVPLPPLGVRFHA